MRSFSFVSMSVRSTVPASQCLITFPVWRSMSTRWLFSCSVTTAIFFWLISINSGSGSVGNSVGTPTRSTVRVVQCVGLPLMSTMTTKPGGDCGGSPFPSSSSRSFSIAMAAYFPSGLTAILSGCPPRSILRTIWRVLRLMICRTPEVLTKFSLVLTTPNAYFRTTATDVGSPPTASVPSGRGSDGSLISTNPIFCV